MKLLPLSLLIGASIALLPTPSSAQTSAAKTTLVLDASGSMWGQIDGEAKIAIAKDVVGNLIRTLPDGMELGLTVYGHRRKGDCGDIESLFVPAPGQRDEIISRVNAISPKGKTPLSAAVLKAAEALRYTEERASVILISDGEETCDLDPCAIGRELERTGIDFTVHAVGFDINDDKTRRQLQCLTEETGGTYHSADDAASLAEALQNIAEPGPAPQEARLDGPAQAAAGAQISITWQGPAHEGDFLAVVPQGGDAGTLMASADLRDGNPLSLKGPPKPGPHDLVYVDYETGTVLARAPIDITEVSAQLASPERAWAGTTITFDWQGPAGDGDYIGVAKTGAPLAETVFHTETSAGTPARLRMPSSPGSYEIRYITNTDPRVILMRQSISVDDVDLTLKAPSTAVAGATLKVLWNGTSNPKDYIAFAHPGAPLPHIVTMAETGEGNPLGVPVPEEPGAYELRYYFAEGDRIVRQLPVTVE